jgi:hypothetical protein
MKRKRKLDGRAMLDQLLFGEGQSYNGISMQLIRRNGIDISKQGLHQRHNEQMEEFIKAVFAKALSITLPEEEIKGLELVIKDSTRFALPPNMAERFPGNGGAGMKAGATVQFEFGIKSGKSSIKLTAANIYDQHESNLDMETIMPGQLYLRDLGYAHQKYMSNIEEKKAFFINKLTPKTLIYTRNKEGYQKLDLQKIKGVFDGQAYIGKEKMPVRIIIEPVSDELKNKRVATNEKYNKRKGSKTSEHFKQRAGFNIMLTNLSVKEYNTVLIQKLYHLRWQIELVFKAWKSFLEINNIRKAGPKRITCVLYAKLIWAILSWKICQAIGKIGHVSILKVHNLIADTRESLYEQFWKINSKWLQMLKSIPFMRLQKEQRKYRLKTEEMIISV